MSTKTQEPARDLKDVRRELDVIDDAIQDLLMKRTELVVEVAEAKARAASAAGAGSFIAFRPGREAEVLRRLAARQTGRFPLKVVFRLFREIISTMTGIQGPFRVDVFGAGDTLAYWDLARSYYGSSTPMELHDNARDVLRRAGSDPSVVAILPEPGNFEGTDWWPSLARSGPDGARVVARLPFLDVDDEAEMPKALVVTQATFDETGDDTSLLVVSTQGNVSEAAIAARVKAVGFDATRVSVAQTKEGGATRHNLFAVKSYVKADDARLADLVSEGPAEHAVIIGGYANPVRRAKDGK
ncbi:MAG: chorismate mutase [Parvibaculum sp.]|nr:chorismate mutase [Parvibaculum sp.]